jgi:hypothetical protein
VSVRTGDAAGPAVVPVRGVVGAVELLLGAAARAGRRVAAPARAALAGRRGAVEAQRVAADLAVPARVRVRLQVEAPQVAAEGLVWLAVGCGVLPPRGGAGVDGCKGEQGEGELERRHCRWGAE